MNDASAYMVKVTRLCEVPTSNVLATSSAREYWSGVIATQPWYDEDKEHLVALLINTDGDVQGFSLISIGSIKDTVAYPREIFRAAVASGAYAIVLMHNHPGSAATPSEADKKVTLNAQACGRVLDVSLWDHIIVASNGASYSFRENGLL